MIIAFNPAQFFLQRIHFGFTEGQLFFQLIAARSVAAQCVVQLVTANACTLFRAAVSLNANILHLLMQLFQHIAAGVVSTFQRCQHLRILRQLGLMLPQPLASTRTFAFGLFKTLTQLLIQIAAAGEHASRIGVAKMRATLYHFGEGKRLLTGITLLLLRLLIICF